MSRYATIQAVAFRDARLKPRDITVLGCLGIYADENGYCHPSLSTIGRMLGISRQAVQKSVRHLEECGYLTRQERFETYGGYKRQATNLYHVNADYVPPESAMRSLEKEGDIDEEVSTGGCTPPQPVVAPPATPEVAPPATPEVAPKNNPDEQPRGSEQANACLSARKKSPAKSNRKPQLETDHLPISQELARELIDYRRMLRKPLTQRSLDQLAKNIAQTASELRITHEQVVAEMQEAGWQSVKPDWMRRRLQVVPAGQQARNDEPTLDDWEDTGWLAEARAAGQIDF